MKLVVLVALIWTINATTTEVAVDISTAEDFCHNKEPNVDYEQFISNFTPIINATKPSKECAKHIRRFQISLVSANQWPFMTE